MMVFTLNVDESKEDLVMGGYLPVSLSNAHIFKYSDRFERMGLQFWTKQRGRRNALGASQCLLL